MFVLLSILFSCGPKEEKAPAPILGWHKAEGWSHECFHPDKFEAMPEMKRRESREFVMDAIFSQWKGEKPGGFTLDDDRLDEIDTVFLGDMSKIERVSRENLSKCKQVATGALSVDEWKSWVVKLPKTLTVGECSTHFLDKVFDDVEIDTAWLPTDPLPICGGNQIVISSSEMDKYQIEEGGPWINVNGDRNKPTVGSSLPCNTEGCFAGMFIMRFQSKDGDSFVLPVGKSLDFTAPSDGVITYGINDDTWFDNKWYTENGLQHHAEVQLSPSK